MAIRGDHYSPDWGRGSAALGIALILHGILGWGLSQRKPVDIMLPKFSVLDVTLIQTMPSVAEPSAQEPVAEPKPKPIKEPEPAPISVPTSAPVILATPETVTPTDQGVASIAPQAAEQSIPGKIYIPSQWALEPALSEDNLQGFADDMDCLRSLSPDCTALRKDVFAEQQLTETELVWTKKYAHTGLPAEYYGMSEQEILHKLGVPIAGQNGQVLIPGILSIDGAIWDKLHGVNKSCGVKMAVKTDAAPMGFARDCKKLRPAAKDEKYAIQNGDPNNE